MKLDPQYSYEYNQILNPEFNEDELIKNFASLLSDKDRFFALLHLLGENSKFIEERLGYSLSDEVEFYVVRAEKFKSFSKPITIEYSICPEEMIMYLMKEILKISITDRFPNEVVREQFINSFLDYVAINGSWRDIDLVKFGKDLHDYSKEVYSNYEFRDFDFSKMTLNEHLMKYYDENPM